MMTATETIAHARRMTRRDVELAKLERDLSEWLQQALPTHALLVQTCGPAVELPAWAQKEIARGVACGLHVRVTISPL